MRKNITYNQLLEKEIGFARAVRIGNIIAVTGTAPIAVDGSVQSPGNVYEQAKRCLIIIKDVVEQAGGKLEDVIRTRILLKDMKTWKDAAKAHGEFFANIQPACTFMEVNAFIKPEWLIEIEADCVCERRTRINFMQYYKTHTPKLNGTHFPRLMKKASVYYKEITAKTKRRPYIRSAYFNKQKVFLGLFWHHLHEKNTRDKMRRLPFFPCGIELIQKTRYKPISKENPNKRDEILHRFTGLTPNNEVFFVHVKEDRRTDQKSLISIFPVDSP